MTIRGLIKAGAAVQIARYALRRGRLLSQRQRARRKARNAIAAAAGLAAGAALLWFLSGRREATPAWVLKKQRKQARRDAALRARERTPARPPEVHVETGAESSLKVPLGDQAK